MVTFVRDGSRAVAGALFDSVATVAASLHALTGVGNLLDGGSNAILLYHGVAAGDEGSLFGQVGAERLRADIRRLSSDFQFVPLEDLAGGRGQGMLGLTFDDGLASFYSDALPVLREFGVPATVFVSPELVGDRNPDLVAERHGTAGGGRVMLTDAEVAALADDPLVTVGNHTLTHPRLDDVASAGRLHAEIVEAKDRLETRYGITVDAFSYPYGATSEAARRLVRETHAVSVTTRPFLLGSPVPRHDLPRVSAHVSPDRLRWELSPLSDRLNGFRYS